MDENFDPDKGQNVSCRLNEQGDSYVECAECGAQAEIGTVIQAGDVVYSGQVSAGSPDATAALYGRILELAREICGEVKAESSDEAGGAVRRYVFTFTCTAEKMIFELRLRNIR